MMRLLLTLLMLAVASPVAAQVEWLPVPEDTPSRQDLRPAVGEWHFGLDIGFANYIPGVFKERGTRFDVFVERQVHRNFAIQADANCSRGQMRQLPGDPQEQISLCSGVVSAVVPFKLRPKVWPYARVGYGMSFWDEQAREGYYDLDDTSPVWVLAGGVRSYFDANQTIGLRVDVQRQETTLRELKVPHWSFGFGLSIRVPRFSPED